MLSLGQPFFLALGLDEKSVVQVPKVWLIDSRISLVSPVPIEWREEGALVDQSELEITLTFRAPASHLEAFVAQPIDVTHLPPFSSPTPKGTPES